MLTQNNVSNYDLNQKIGFLVFICFSQFHFHTEFQVLKRMNPPPKSPICNKGVWHHCCKLSRKLKKWKCLKTISVFFQNWYLRVYGHQQTLLKWFYLSSLSLTLSYTHTTLYLFLLHAHTLSLSLSPFPYRNRFLSFYFFSCFTYERPWSLKNFL